MHPHATPTPPKPSPSWTPLLKRLELYCRSGFNQSAELIQADLKDLLERLPKDMIESYNLPVTLLRLKRQYALRNCFIEGCGNPAPAKFCSRCHQARYCSEA